MNEPARTTNHPEARSLLLEVGMVAFIAAGTIHLLSDAWDPKVESLAAAVRHFSQSSLDRSCSPQGFVVAGGMPCADQSGFRFVLGKNGRYSLFSIADGEPPQQVADSDAPGRWSGSKEQLEKLERYFATGSE